MYITSSEYNTITGRPANECTTIRLTLACKLLDARIGNYLINSDGYKIRSSDFAVYSGNTYQVLHKSKIDAVKMWVASMISYLTDNNNKPPTSANNLKLGRFSIGKSTPDNTNLPSDIQFVDSILVSSGIIKRKVLCK